MTFYDSVKGWFGRAFAGRPAASAATESETSSGDEAGMPVVTKMRPRTDEKWLDTYGRLSLLDSPVDRIKKDTGSVRWHLYRRLPGPVGPNGKPQREEVTAHELLDLWNRPNPLHDRKAFVELLTLYRMIVGKAPVWIERKQGSRRPKYLWPIVPTDIVKLPTKREPFWQFRFRGKKKRVPLMDIIFLFEPDPKDPYGPGLGAARSCEWDVALVEYMLKWSAMFFRQGAHLGKVANLPGLSPQQQKDLQAAFARDHEGIENSHRVFFTGGQGGPVTVHDLGASHKELDYNASLSGAGDRIRQRFSVPPEVIGDVSNSNRATAEAADYIHQKNNILEQVGWHEGWVNIHVVPLYDEPDLYLEPENPVRETTEMRHQMITDGAKSGFATRDEWRTDHGLDPLGPPMGDRLLVPVNMVAIPARPGANPPASANGARAVADIPNWMLAAAHLMGGADR